MRRGDKKARGRPREFDADKALDRAMRVFWRKGFLGASLTDLTRAMRVSRPSLYAAFGDKEQLFRRALERYFEGPSSYTHEALRAPTARAVVEQILYGAINMLTGPGSPATCMWVRCARSRLETVGYAASSQLSAPKATCSSASVSTVLWQQETFQQDLTLTHSRISSSQ